MNIVWASTIGWCTVLPTPDALIPTPTVAPRIAAAASSNQYRGRRLLSPCVVDNRPIPTLLPLHGIAGGSAYCASKFGLNGLTEAMMQDFRYEGIRVSTIMPGSIATDFGGPAGSNLHEPWKLSGRDIAKAVIDTYRYPGFALVSRIEIRPLQPPRKNS